MNYRFRKISGRLLSAITAMAVIAPLSNGCSKDSVEETFATPVSDYSLTENWLSLPAPVNGVDVFYVYPTAWNKSSDADPNICSINNETMRKGAASAYNRQATAFETSCNIFAPYYRQVDAAYALGLSAEEHKKVIAGAPTEDIEAAFTYYIDHLNQGRPFMLAGHSQGSDVLLNLLSGYMKNHPNVYSRMVAAWIIGYPVTAEYMAANSHLKFAEGPDDLGVIISFNTQAPDVAAGSNPVVGNEVGIAINPINWKRDTTLATVTEGLGSMMPDLVTFLPVAVPQYADARVDPVKGVLICSTADADALLPFTAIFGRGVYHSFDYPFYYFNIRENATRRAEKFLSLINK